MENKNFKSGFVTIVGRPNVGKSTLINNLIGEKLTIISDKPQTTRNQIRFIITGEDHQIIFIDTPGINKPKNKLGTFMLHEAESTFSEVDVILFLVECDTKAGKGDKYIIDRLKESKTPVILVINKIDLIKKEEIFAVINEYKDLMDFDAIIPISALRGESVSSIVTEVKKYLPEGPKYFPDDMITDQPERQIVAELIREKILNLIRDEIPHGVAVEITTMKERSDKNIIDIGATIFCEKKSHKGIIIGKNGDMLKKIGSTSRIDIERLLGAKVFLELWVKIREDWRNSENMMKNFGFK